MQLKDSIQSVDDNSCSRANDEMSRTTNVRQIDLTDSTYAALGIIAGRIAALLSSPLAKNNPGSSGSSCNDFLGAVYALIFAKEADFTHRPNRQIDIAAVENSLSS